MRPAVLTILIVLIVLTPGCALLPHIATIGIALLRSRPAQEVLPPACWDTNGNGQFDPAEDMDGDGRATIMDCRIDWDEYTRPPITMEDGHE